MLVATFWNTVAIGLAFVADGFKCSVRVFVIAPRYTLVTGTDGEGWCPKIRWESNLCGIGDTPTCMVTILLNDANATGTGRQLLGSGNIGRD